MSDEATLLFKCACVVLIFTFGLAGAQASRSLKSRDSRRGLAIGNCFAGGIFIGAGLIHTLADSAGLFESLAPGMNFPLWATIAAFAIVTLMGIDHGLSATSTKGRIGGMALFVVLSLHSLVAGMALGIEAHPVQALAILLAILAHKGGAAFALGLRIPDAGYWRRMSAFAATTPVGVLLGTTLTFLVQDGSERYFEAVFDAIAAGTFLYVALAEILPREFEHTDRPWQLTVSVLLGLSLMGLLALYT